MKESDIRNRSVFNRYLEMVDSDVSVFFKDHFLFEKMSCPGCQGTNCPSVMKKLGFTYTRCIECGTLFVNPRPPLSDLIRFYSESPSSRFWVTDFFMPVVEARRKKIFQPRARYIADFFNSQKDWIIGDIGAGFGLFLEELRALWPENRFVAVEPSPEMAQICRGKKLEVISKAIEEVPENKWKFDLLTCFELFEHLHDPRRFMKKLLHLLKPGGTLLLTTLNGNGFDIQILSEKSKSLTPPHHLNFLTPHSIGKLLRETGFDITEISTPGELDWDIVEGMRRDENIDLGPFWNQVYYEVSPEGKQQLQSWIRSNGLSSHMRVLAKRPVSLIP